MTYHLEWTWNNLGITSFKTSDQGNKDSLLQPGEKGRPGCFEYSWYSCLLSGREKKLEVKIKNEHFKNTYVLCLNLNIRFTNVY